MLLLSLVLSPKTSVSSQADATSSIRYAQPDGQATGDCLSWEDACDLQYTLGIAESGDEIWAAEGIYYPGSVVTDSFQLRDGVGLYGGFPADGGDWDQRDWTAYPTVLSGDIDQNDLTNNGIVIATDNITGTNAYHVVSSELLTSTFLDGLTITAGNANGSYISDDEDGGGLYNNGGNITLTDVTFSGNMASYYGGGMINASGIIMLNDVTFTSNQAIIGGGLYNNTDSTATLTGVAFNNNQASFSSGGLANGGNVTLNNVIFSNNHAPSSGGMSNGGNIVLTNVTFSSNYGGGLVNAYNAHAILTDVTFSNNWNPNQGGGMTHSGGTAVLNNVIFSGNTGSDGGGMSSNWGTVALSNVTFSGNTAMSRGGGMFNSDTATLTNVTFSSNHSDHDGGGIYSFDGSLMLTNVTFSDNSSVLGGGLYNFSSSPTLTNVTFFSNSATQNGGGIYNIEYNGVGSHPILTNTILWGNIPDQIYNDDLSSATVTYSDIQEGWDGEGNINLDPLLDPLANNGGFTLTHALRSGSPAIDTGSPATCRWTDQRGYLRPFDGDGDGVAVCDMGTYEYGSIPPLKQYLLMVVK